MRRVQRELIRMIGAISDENPIRPDGLERREIVDPNGQMRCKTVNNCTLLLKQACDCERTWWIWIIARIERQGDFAIHFHRLNYAAFKGGRYSFH